MRASLSGTGDSAEAARLASLVNIGELLASLGIPREAYETELNLAFKAFSTRWWMTLALPAPQKDLQKDLTVLVCEELPRLAKALSGQRPMPGSMWFAPI